MMFFSVFAFGFASPFLLWGLALGGVPILIHLLNRRKFRETQWAAMRFLMEAVRKNARRIQLEQLLLLVLRVLILLLLVAALARPHFEQLSRYYRVDLPVHRIIVIDSSLSMGYEIGGRSRFEQAREFARQIALDARQGDALNLVRICDVSPRVIVAKPAFQSDEVVNEIAQLQLLDERGDVQATLRDVETLLQTAPELTEKEVYLITDLQRTNWGAEVSSQPTEFRSLLRKIAERSQLNFIDLGQTSSQNHAVTDFRGVDTFSIAGRPSQFRAAVTTWGSSPAPEQTLELFVDGKLQDQKLVDLQPGTETVVMFNHTFAAGREYRMSVRLSPDPLQADNQRFLANPVRDEIRVLCVNGKLAGQPRGNATYHLELALAPGSDSQQDGSLIRPKVIKYGELRGFDLSTFDCVFLCNVSSFDAGEAEILESYLRSGGGVIWCLGDRVQAENYNQRLFRGGDGILPARIGDRRGNATTQQESFVFEASQLNVPIVNVFQGNPDSGLETTRTYEYFQCDIADNNRSRVILDFSTGDPAIIESSVGAGKALLVTTSVDDSWGNWALWPSYVPLIQEMTRYSVSGRQGQRNLNVGTPLVRTLQTRGADVSALVIRPDDRQEPVRVETGANVSEFRYENALSRGFYELRWGSPLARSELYTANIDPLESNLVKMEREEIEQELLRGNEFQYRTDWEELERRAAGPVPDRHGLTRDLLYVTLYLLFVEQLLAWNFSYGLWLLCPPMAALLWWRNR